MMQNLNAKANGAYFRSVPQEEEMEKTFSCILLLLTWATTSSKYVYIEHKFTWFQAQEYCRQHHTDLAHVSNARDNQRLQEKKSEHSWFGLQRNSTCPDKWRWSGGGEVPTFYWGDKQPESRFEEDYGMLYDDGWHDCTAYGNAGFYATTPSW